MCQEFYWTAKLFENNIPKETQYFITQEERDSYVAKHAGWKKRGKICAENLDRHLKENEKQHTHNEGGDR